MTAPLRTDLVPRPDPLVTADLDADLAIAGRWGSGIVFLHSPILRFHCGYDWRRRGGWFEPHPLSRALITGRKSLPWMHHGSMPHAIWPRAGERADLYAILGTFGPRHDWGDGTEHNFPGYGVMKAARPRASAMWEDGRALDIVVECDQHERRERFEDGDFQFVHRPGSLDLRQRAGGAWLDRVLLLLEQTQGRQLRVAITLHNARTRACGLRARLALRLLLRKLALPPDDWRASVDVLCSPFGFGRFTECDLAVRAGAGGVQYASAAEDLSLALRLTPHADTLFGACDPCSDRRAALSPLRGAAACRAADVELVTPFLALAAGERATVTLDLELDAAAAPRATVIPHGAGAAAATEQAAEGPAPLELCSGHRHVDALVRWGRSVARSLLWPNGVIATGALGYGGKSHVGQDVPFIYPLYLLEAHPRFEHAARANLDYLWSSASLGEGDGVQDHPCEGLDFAFIPFHPRRARFWKRAGGTGFLRQLIALHRYLVFTGDEERAYRCFTVAREKLLRSYLPFQVSSQAWSAGEETQALIYALVTAPEALLCGAALAREFADPGLAARLLEAREAVIAQLERPLGNGGFLVTERVVGADGRAIEPGLLLASPTPLHPALCLSFDVLLYNAVALGGDAVRGAVRASIARELARASSRWLVPGAGLAKEQGGGRGVWFWHNALAVRALFRAADLDAHYRDVAFERLEWMGRGLADINGLGCPGEEVNGGDYAMGIGCLPALYALEGLLGFDFEGVTMRLNPCLPAKVRELAVRNLWFRQRAYRVRVTRGAAAASVLLPSNETDLTLTARP